MIDQSNLNSESAEPRQSGTTDASFDQREQVVHGNQINVAGDYVVLQPGTTRRLTDVEDYLAAVRDYCDNQPYLTLYDIGPSKSLDEVYVPLKVRPQPRKTDKPEQTTESAQREVPRTESLPIADMLRQHDQPNVLILGGPGTGKSVLLRQMAKRAWDAPQEIGLSTSYLPLLVSLRQLASVGGSLDERLSEVLKNEMALLRAMPDGFLDEWPQQTGARWLILLDALDEVPVSERARFMQWLKGQFVNLRQSRIVITCRPAGYSASELDDKVFAHYDLQLFTSGQTNELAGNWFNDKANDFLSELDRVRVGELRGTPLLLTIAAKVFLTRGELPERRTALYEQFVDTWLQESIEHRGLKDELGEPVCDVAKFALAKLALKMTEQPAATEASLSEVAAAYLKETVPLSAERARVAGVKFVRVMAQRSGVFVRQGNTNTFVHPTFREHLAATEIVRECSNDEECIWRHVIARWQEESWAEVARFTLGELAEREVDSTEFIERIANSSEEGLLFAGKALADGATVSSGCGNKLLDQLLRKVEDEFISTPFLNVVASIQAWTQATSSLLKLANDMDTFEGQRQDIAESLEAYNAKAAAQIWFGLAKEEYTHAEMRAEAIVALERLRYARGLLDLVRDPHQRERTRLSALKALSRLEAYESLMALVRNKRLADEWRQRAYHELTSQKTSNWLVTLAGNRGSEKWLSKWAIDELSSRRAHQELLNLACDNRVSVRVRTEALDRLGVCGETSGLPDLDLIARTPRNEKMSAAANQAARRIRARLTTQSS